MQADKATDKIVPVGAGGWLKENNPELFEVDKKPELWGFEKLVNGVSLTNPLFVAACVVVL